MPLPQEERHLEYRQRLSLLSAVLFFANPIGLSLANFWERIISDPLPALLFVQLEFVYALLAFSTGRPISRKQPRVWLWLVPVILAGVVMCAQIAFTLYHRFVEGSL